MMIYAIDGGNMTARLNIEIDEDVKKGAQKRAIDDGTSLRQIVTDALCSWLGMEEGEDDNNKSGDDGISEKSDIVIS